MNDGIVSLDYEDTGLAVMIVYNTIRSNTHSLTIITLVQYEWRNFSILDMDWRGLNLFWVALDVLDTQR